ncbi:protein-L-isoaspartate(D-aspartate) O-methyltransferase [Cocleimonas sp. KMM 6896]|nr:protein-L-isoaspartate(D-aspartate) O-methyltransferase [Cocleimonas sp. KMM 6896]
MTSQRTRDRLIDRLQDKGIVNSDVLRVMRLVPRHLFVDEAMASRSYEDASFPIGHGQTISQPFIVARMTELIMQSESLENVLEVGTGSGYQAAVLGGLVKNLHTVEVVTELHRNARDLLYKLGYRNIRTHLGDGSWGWEEAAPYDAIMVTAAPDEIPSALIQQLKIGGRMIIPVGAQNSEQKLQVVTRNNETNYSVENHESVIFVPLVGG